MYIQFQAPLIDARERKREQRKKKLYYQHALRPIPSMKEVLSNLKAYHYGNTLSLFV